jgi:FkbM family methyltransferase
VQSKGGRVVVFEPDLTLAYLLRRTADTNPDLDVSIFPFAVSNKDGVAQFNIAERARATNFLAEAHGSTQTGGVRRTLTVPTIRLDTVLNWFAAPDFVKIDVEGAEHLVLAGMEQVLSVTRPIILCEVSIENQAFVAGVNIVGTDGNQLVYGGDSAIIDFSGQHLCQISHCEGVFTTVLSLEKLPAYRQQLPFLRDGDTFRLI